MMKKKRTRGGGGESGIKRPRRRSREDVLANAQDAALQFALATELEEEGADEEQLLSAFRSVVELLSGAEALPRDQGQGEDPDQGMDQDEVLRELRLLLSEAELRCCNLLAKQKQAGACQLSWAVRQRRLVRLLKEVGWPQRLPIHALSDMFYVFLQI